jgi:ADP-ribose pyrophosphatase YjhB (NUDIX family)
MDSIVSVSVLVFRDESILFLKETQDRVKYTLKLPGGRIEDGEDLEECAARYIKDSVGIDVELDRTLGGIITRKNKQGKLLITFVFLAEAMDRRTPTGTIYIPHKDVSITIIFRNFPGL